MARVQVASQAWGYCVDADTGRPRAGALHVINTTVYEAATGAAEIDPALYVTDAEGLLPGFVDVGTWLQTDPDDDTIQVEAFSGLDSARLLVVESARSVAYGAGIDPTGATDSTTAVQALIDALTGGGVLFFPPGTYKFDTRLSLKDKVTLAGAGREATVLKTGGTGVATALLIGLSANTVTDGSVVDLTIDGNSVGAIGGIQVTDGARFRVEGCRIRNTTDQAVKLSTTPDSIVKGNWIDTIGVAGSTHEGGVEIFTGSDRTQVVHNNIKDVTGFAVRIGYSVSAAAGGPADCVVANNEIDQLGSLDSYECVGVSGGSPRTKVCGNTCNGAGDNGISFNGSEGVVSGNTVTGAQAHGIQVGTSDSGVFYGHNSVVTGNVCKNNGQTADLTRGGINLNGADGVTVTGNRCFDDQATKTQNYGIKGSDDSSGCTVSGNQLSGNKDAPISAFAAGNAIDLDGTGTPEGAVSAPVGATFRRTDGGASTSFYVKQSGVGNTGWAAK